MNLRVWLERFSEAARVLLLLSAALLLLTLTISIMLGGWRIPVDVSYLNRRL